MVKTSENQGVRDEKSKESPNERLFALLESIAKQDAPFTLQALVNQTGLPKPSLYRMLQQLEHSGLLQRDLNGRHYSTGQRLTRLAESVLINSTTRGARHSALRRLVDAAGESCNLTAFSGGEVLYLDRVETAAPLRFYLHPGSRVPAHCSATGKLFLSEMTIAQRRLLWQSGPLERFTERTIVDVQGLEAEIRRVKQNGYALDDEEFLPGLLCIGVLIPSQGAASNMGIAIQAPKIRFSKERALQCLPMLKDAALTISQLHLALPQTRESLDDER